MHNSTNHNFQHQNTKQKPIIIPLFSFDNLIVSTELKDTTFPNQKKGNKVFISTINATGTAYKTAQTATARKDNRIAKLLCDNPTKTFLFIDDSLFNISTAQSLNDNRLTCVHYPSGMHTIDINSVNQDVLLLDFDSTLTCHHTFQKYQINSKYQNHDPQISFNEDIITLLKNFTGEIIILTDHNNHEFVTKQIYRAIAQTRAQALHQLPALPPIQPMPALCNTSMPLFSHQQPPNTNGFMPPANNQFGTNLQREPYYGPMSSQALNPYCLPPANNQFGTNLQREPYYGPMSSQALSNTHGFMPPANNQFGTNLQREPYYGPMSSQALNPYCLPPEKLTFEEEKPNQQAAQEPYYSFAP